MSNSINAKFRSDMADFIFKAKAARQKINKEVLLEVGRRLVDRSVVGNPHKWHPPYWPKDYNPGRFINNWQVGIDVMPTGTIDAVDPTGAASLERLSHLGRWTMNHTFYFANNLPYARLLENGTHTVQAAYMVPQGIVGLTTMEFPQIVRQAVQNYAKG